MVKKRMRRWRKGNKSAEDGAARPRSSTPTVAQKVDVAAIMRKRAANLGKLPPHVATTFLDAKKNKVAKKGLAKATEFTRKSNGPNVDTMLLALVHKWFLEQQLKDTAQTMEMELHEDNTGHGLLACHGWLAREKPECSLSSIVSSGVGTRHRDQRTRRGKVVGRKKGKKGKELRLQTELLSMVHNWFLRIGCKTSAGSMLSELEPKISQKISSCMPQCSLTTLLEAAAEGGMHGGQRRGRFEEDAAEPEIGTELAAERIHESLHGTWTEKLALKVKSVQPTFFDSEDEEEDEDSDARPSNPFLITEAEEVDDAYSSDDSVRTEGSQRSLGSKCNADSAIPWESKGPHVRETLLRVFPGQPGPVKAVVTRWAPAGSGSDEPALWHVVHADGDEEDLERSEVEDGIKAFREFKRQAMQGATEALGQGTRPQAACVAK